MGLLFWVTTNPRSIVGWRETPFNKIYLSFNQFFDITCNDILFFIYFQVSAAGQCAQGSGPNKKLAKRAAAEALLQLMGYSRPSLQPSKPALKTSHSNGSTASTTSSSSMSCSSLTNGEIKEKTKKVRRHFYHF